MKITLRMKNTYLSFRLLRFEIIYLHLRVLKGRTQGEVRRGWYWV